MGRHKYDGGWAFGLQEGQGVMTFRSGDIYQGKFEENLRHLHMSGHHIYLRQTLLIIYNKFSFDATYILL